MKEIKLKNLEDPVGFTLKTLQRSAQICEVIQTSPKESVASLYRENTTSIDAIHRDLNVSWNSLKRAVIDAGDGTLSQEESLERLQKGLAGGVGVAQRALDVFDDLCDRYNLPQTDRHLFGKIGTILHP